LSWTDVSLTLPAGAVVAIVGENGAGKDDSGQIAREDVEPSLVNPRGRHAPGACAGGEWARASGKGAFQDFFRSNSASAFRWVWEIFPTGRRTRCAAAVDRAARVTLSRV